MEKLISLRDVLLQKEAYQGWLYLPEEPWTLETKGIFVDLDDVPAGSEPDLPEEVKKYNLHEVLDAVGIEDIIINAKEQIGSPSVDELLSAFVFYVENDAFIVI
jgi:hypothetical protein